jgi:peptidoglycan hydrolase CwlO-like protein
MKDKLDQAHNEVGAKVDTGHDNVKKIVDMHKTNEDLTAQLMTKNDVTTGLHDKLKEHQDEIESHKKNVDDLQKDADDHTNAYEALLD